MTVPFLIDVPKFAKIIDISIEADLPMNTLPVKPTLHPWEKTSDILLSALQ